MATTFHYSTLAEEADQEIDFSLSPAVTFIDVKNLKPGDTITKTLTVSNSGLMDFSYLMNSYKDSGSDLFYNQLHLQVSIDDTQLYNGPLYSFSGMEARDLVKSTSEEMKLKVTFPWESGNEFQGLATKVIFQFIAERDYATDGIPTGGGMLPQTGEEGPGMYYMLGGVLVCAGLALYATSRYIRRE